jgi:hypothetical protein
MANYSSEVQDMPHGDRLTALMIGPHTSRLRLECFLEAFASTEGRLWSDP